MEARRSLDTLSNNKTLQYSTISVAEGTLVLSPHGASPPYVVRPQATRVVEIIPPAAAVGSRDRDTVVSSIPQKIIRVLL